MVGYLRPSERGQPARPVSSGEVPRKLNSIVDTLSPKLCPWGASEAAQTREPARFWPGCSASVMTTGHDTEVQALTPPPLLTVGYEGRSVAEVVAALVKQSVSLVVDVRLTPLSRKPGLSKRRLGEHLAAVGINYLHLPALGNPRDNRDGFRAGTAASRARFIGLLKEPLAERSLAEIVEHAACETVALLCFEADPMRCHRHLISDAVVRLVGHSPSVHV